MPPTKKRISLWKKILLSLLIFFVLIAVAFHIFMTRYLPPLIKDKMSDLIVRGSDSLYRFELGKINLSFWGRSFRCENLSIFIDSNRYRQLRDLKRLPAMTFDLELPSGEISGIDLITLLFHKKLNLSLIDMKEANLSLSRHFGSNANNADSFNIPLWKSISPGMSSIAVQDIRIQNVKIKYKNADSATAFGWQFDSCYAAISDIRVDSSAAYDTSRMLYASNIALTVRAMKMKLPDGMYGLYAKSLFYASSLHKVEVEEFALKQEVDNATFTKHFGYQHEIYGISATNLRLVNFDLPALIRNNELNVDSVFLKAPAVNVYLDRNAPENPYSKLGKYPHQLIQRASVLIRVKRLNAVNGSFTYREKSNTTQLTATMNYSGINGIIENITNDSVLITRSPYCVADIHSQFMQTGIVHAIFRFNLADRGGAFNLSASIANLDANQLKGIIKATASADLQSLKLHQLNYNMTANEHSGVGSLKMTYEDMDVLINSVREDGSFNKKGLLSFVVNHMLIYQENPSKNGEERVANNVHAERAVTKSFFNFIWKTLYTAAGKIILRPVAQRKMEKRRLKNKQ